MKNTNESGRSMVEMLGVLAIIGVLSIGGIAGYTRAMRTWRVNEIFDAANRVVAMVESEIATSGSLTYDGLAGTNATGKIAGGIVKSITAYNMTHATKANTVEVVVDANKNGSDIVDLAKDKLGCSAANATCKISKNFTFTITASAN